LFVGRETPDGSVLASLWTKDGGELNAIFVACTVGNTLRDWSSYEVANGSGIIQTFPVMQALRCNTLSSGRQSGWSLNTPNFGVKSTAIVIGKTLGVTNVRESRVSGVYAGRSRR